MLTQEELDKLLEEGGDSADDKDKQDEQDEQEAAAAGESPQQPLSQDELDKLMEGEDSTPEDKDEKGHDAAEADDDIDWSDAFKEAAEGGDAAAAKAVQKGSAAGEEDAAKPGEQAAPPEFGELKEDSNASKAVKPELDFLLEIPLDISVELGRRSMKIKELLQLGQGSVVELNKMAGEPADIYVNKKLMAKGEVVVVNEKFGIKLTEIISPAERVKSLG